MIICFIVEACVDKPKEDNVFTRFEREGLTADIRSSEGESKGVIIIKKKPIKYMDFRYQIPGEVFYSRAAWFGVLWTEFLLDKEKGTISLYGENKELLITILIINSNTMKISDIGKGMYDQVSKIEELPYYIRSTNVKNFYIDKTISSYPKTVSREKYFEMLINDENTARMNFFQGPFSDTNHLYDYY